MKKLLLLILMGFLFYFGNAQPFTIDFGKSESGIRFIETQPEKIVMSFKYDQLNAVDVTTKKGVFSQIDLKGAYRSGNVGEPQLPSSRKIIQIPFGASVTVKVLSSELNEYKLADYGIKNKILPFQPSYSKSIDPSTVDLILNETAYKQNNFTTQQLASVETLGVLRGIRLAKVEVNPVQYNPVTNTIKVYNNINVEVSFNGGDLSKTDEIRQKSFSPYFETLYNDFINSGSSAKTNYTDNPDHTKYPVKYLIVTAPQFVDQLAPFIDWKTKKGFKVIMATTDQIGSTAAAIKTWIHGQYNSATATDPAPTFLLLVGDTPQIPASQIGADSQKATDLYYACVDGATDIFPDMYYGRFSAQTATQLQNMIDKVLYYEKYEFADDSYLNRATLIAGADATWNPAVGQPTINYGTTNYFNAAHGFTNVNAYLNSYSGCYNADKFAVSLINYTAHCSETSWADPILTQNAVNALSNTNKYPLAIANCCLSTDFGYGECLGETWMRKANAGSVAYIGSSPESYWYEDFYWAVGAHSYSAGHAPTVANSTVGAYDAPYVSNYLCVDALIFVGNLAVSEAHDMGTNTSISEKYYWEGYNCLSDPSIFINLTQADENTVTHLPTLPIGVAEFEVSAAPGSYVAISKDGVLHGTALVSASGTVNVAINPIVSAGNVDIVVTKSQYKPYITSIPAASLNGPYLTVEAIAINDAAGNNNGTADYGESLGLNLSIKNIGSQTSSGITASMATTSPYVESFANNTNVVVGDIAANNSTTVTGSFNLVLTNNVPDQSYITLNITLTDNASKSTYSTTKTILVNAPKLVVKSFVIDDSGSGNNNNILDPNENAIVLVTIENQGHASITADASLTFANGSSTVMSITNGNASLGVINAGALAIAQFDVSANTGTPNGTPEDLTVTVNSTFSAYNTIYNSQVVIGLIPEFNMGSQSTVTTSVGLFYDSGGPNAKYQSNENYTITFIPTISGQLMKISFNSFTTEASYDFLKVYDGTSTSAPLMGSFNGTVSPGTLIATNNLGALTFAFTSDESIVKDGWEATIETVDQVNIQFNVNDGLNPIAGANVTFNGSTLPTNANGQALFSLLDDQTIKSYSVTANGFYNFQGTLNALKDTIVNLQLTFIPDVTFLINDQNGSPLNGVKTVFNNQTRYTNTNGNVVFNDVIPQNDMPLNVSLDTYSSLDTTISLSTNNLNVGLTLVKLPTITFVIKDSIGNPLPDARVKLNNIIIKTNAQGVAEFVGSTPGDNQQYEVYLTDYFTISDSVDVAYSNLTIEKILYAVPIVQFIVTKNSLPQSNITVQFDNQNLVTNEYGEISTRVYKLGVFPYSVSVGGHFPINGDVTIKNSNVSVSIELIEIPDVRLTVHEKGVALSNVSVKLGDQTMPTDLNGQANFIDINSGKYSFEISNNGYYNITDSLNVEQQNVERTFELTPIPDAKFIITNGSAPIAGASVTFANQSKISNAQGEVLFIDVPAGKHHIKVEKNLFDTYSDSITIETLNLNETIIMELQTFAVSFVVTDGQNGIAGASVSIHNEVKQTSDNGTVVFEGLPIAENYSFEISKTGYFSETGSVNIVDKDVTKNIELTLITYLVSFNVTDTEGPVSGAEVSFNEETQITNTAGTAEFIGIKPGTDLPYSISKTGTHTTHEGTVTVSQNQTVNVLLNQVGVKETYAEKVTFYPNPTIGFITVQVDANDINDLSIEITDQSGRIVKSLTQTGVLTLINLSELSSGVYFIKMSNSIFQKTEKLVLE